jgi:hypothetical protein
MTDGLEGCAALARPARRGAAAARLLAWVALFASGEGVLYGAGHGRLAAPPLTVPSHWVGWLEGRPPVAAAFGLLRLAGLALGGYLLAVTALGLLVQVAVLAYRDGPGAITSAIARAVEVVTVPGLRALLEAAVGVGVVAGVFTAPTWAAEATATGATGAFGSGPPPAAGAPADDGPTMQRLDGADLPDQPAPDQPQPDQPPPDQPRPDQPGPDLRPERAWTVVPGESFWVIARERLTATSGRHPSDGEVARYCVALIGYNRTRLRHPGDPNLIYPGQHLVLPPTSPPA